MYSTRKSHVPFLSRVCPFSYCLDSSLNITKVRGNVLVCLHAGSSAESKLAKSAVVKEAGGVGMVLIDETDRDVAIPFVIPAAIVGRKEGHRILTYINNTRFVTSVVAKNFSVFFFILFSPLLLTLSSEQ